MKTPKSGEDTSLAELRSGRISSDICWRAGGRAGAGGGGTGGIPPVKTLTSGEDTRLAELREGQGQLRHLLEGGGRGGGGGGRGYSVEDTHLW